LRLSGKTQAEPCAGGAGATTAIIALPSVKFSGFRSALRLHAGQLLRFLSMASEAASADARIQEP
jgi:hypothetical protein